MKVFVTGATGFVGSHVARLLSEQGAQLRLLVRAGSRTENIAGLDAERIIGDLSDSSSLRKGMQGCEAVFHVAADYRLWVRRPEEMYKANVEGTRSMLKAAQESGVRRLVYTSSVATMGFSGNGTPCTEDSPVSVTDMIGHYKRSKFLAEELVLAAGRSGFAAVVVNPTTPVGERDIKPTPTGRIIVDFLKKKFPAYVDTGLNLVDVSEVARGHVAALEKARPGERYILGGENLTLKQVFDKLETITGIPAPTIRIPHAVAMLYATWDQTFTGRLLGREPRATVEAVKMGRKKMWASSGKAERDLGWKSEPVDNALERAVDWFKGQGYVN
jgi:dihydroflavonol-4-reductase